MSSVTPQSRERERERERREREKREKRKRFQTWLFALVGVCVCSGPITKIAVPGALC